MPIEKVSFYKKRDEEYYKNKLKKEMEYLSKLQVCDIIHRQLLATYNCENIYEISKITRKYLLELEQAPLSGYNTMDLFIESTLNNLLEFDEEFVNTELTDDMKEWVVREAHNTFNYKEWENHIKKAIYYTLEYYQ